MSPIVGGKGHGGGGFGRTQGDAGGRFEPGVIGGYGFDRGVKRSVYNSWQETTIKSNVTLDGGLLTLTDGNNRKLPECEPVADIIGAVLRSCHGGDGHNARAVWAFWDRVAGERLACNAQPAAFKQQILVVHVSSSAWLQELHFQKRELIERLNQAAGTRVVEDIRFKIGPLPEK